MSFLSRFGLEAAFNLLKKAGSNVTSISKMITGLPKEWEGVVGDWAKIDDEISKFGRTIGASKAELEGFRKEIINTSLEKNIGLKYNIDETQLIQSITKIKADIGKDIDIGINQNLEAIAATMAIFGNKNSQALFSNLNNFGVGIKDSIPYATRLYETSQRTGLSFEKYSGNVINNLKLASKYGFENGIKGLEKMVKSAMALNMEVKDATIMAEKIVGVDNGLEAAIQMGAGLQTLGGSFAMMSDPLYLLNASMNNVGELQNALSTMVSDMATFNKETGEIEINSTNQLLLRQAARKTGVSYDELISGAQRSGIRGVVSEQLDSAKNINGTKISDDLRELILNSATLQNGQAMLETSRGELKTIDEFLKDQSEVENLRQRSTISDKSDSEKLATIAVDLRSIKDIIGGQQKNIQTNVNQFLENGMLIDKKKVGGNAKNIKQDLGTLTAGKDSNGNEISIYGKSVQNSDDAISKATGVISNVLVAESMLKASKAAIKTGAIGSKIGDNAASSAIETIYDINNLGNEMIELSPTLSEMLDDSGIAEIRNRRLEWEGFNPQGQGAYAQFAYGGVVGNKFDNLDNGIDNRLIAAQDGEFVVRKPITEKYFSTLQALNSNDAFTTIINNIASDSGVNISPIRGDEGDISSNTYTPVTNTAATTAQNNGVNGSIDVNVHMGDSRIELYTRDGQSSTIKLDDLMKNPEFEHSIIKLIEDNFVAQFRQGNNVTNGLG